MPRNSKSEKEHSFQKPHSITHFKVWKHECEMASTSGNPDFIVIIIIESQNVLGGKGPQCSSSFNPQNDCPPATKSSPEKGKQKQPSLPFNLATFIHIIHTGVFSQMCAPYIKLKSLKSCIVRLWEKVCLKQQENITERLNYEVQSIWTLTFCFWEEIINGQHKASK